MHDFGGTDGLKGTLALAAEIPFAGIERFGGAPTSVMGSGFTPEGIDQNPIFYELLLSNAFRALPLGNVSDWAVQRAHARYGLVANATSPASQAVSKSWEMLVASNYNSFGTGVWDETGVAHLPASSSQFGPDRRTPSPSLCGTWGAWGALLSASQGAEVAKPLVLPFRYDLINTGREVLAQLSCPLSQDFADAFNDPVISAPRVTATGEAYLDLLDDLDELVGTESAFLLGPWLQAARDLAGVAGEEDCAITDGSQPLPCADFYEWNARAQLTTWKPCLTEACDLDRNSPRDYASKHWGGLIKEYYRARAEQVMWQALEDAGRALNQTARASREGKLAFDFQRNFGNGFPLSPVGDAIEISSLMRAKYAPYFASCGSWAP